MVDSQQVIDDKKKEIVSHIDYSATRIGELVRIIGFGLAGLYFVFSTSSSDFAQNVMLHYTWIVVSISICGCLAVLFEWFQYFLGRRMAYRAVPLARDPDPNKGLFPTDWLKGLQLGMFWAKQGAAVAGTIIFMWLMYKTIPSANV